MSTITETERQNLIDRVQMLLAKAESTEFPAEAEAFRSKAADIMAKFAITNSEFEGTPEYYIRDMETVTEGDPTVWETHIANAIAKFNGLLLVVHTSRTYGNPIKTLKLTGTHSDHSAFNYMYDSVIRQMGSALCNFVGTGKTSTADRTRFMVGFSYGLHDKVTQLMTARNTKIQEYGLVPINEVQKARNWYEMTCGSLSKGKSSKASYDHAGIQAGQNASLHKGVQQNNHHKLAITT